MCVYCEKTDNPYAGAVTVGNYEDIEYYGIVLEDRKELIIKPLTEKDNNDEYFIEINNCPFCGREL